MFDPAEKEYLKKFLPQDIDNDQTIKKLLSGENFCHGNPLIKFHEQLKAGTLTKTFNKEMLLKSRLSEIALKNYYNNSSRLLDIKLDRLRNA